LVLNVPICVVRNIPNFFIWILKLEMQAFVKAARTIYKKNPRWCF
jgi:hypothetical protein